MFNFMSPRIQFSLLAITNSVSCKIRSRALSSSSWITTSSWLASRSRRRFRFSLRPIFVVCVFVIKRVLKVKGKWISGQMME